MKNEDPIAIVGIGCRFPGNASGPDKYWRMLCEGKDAICDIPKDRWDPRRFYDPDPEMPGKTYMKKGGFLEEPIDQFDSLAFGISPREAIEMDPQQRLLLEVTWEAFENSGIPFDQLKEETVGVFIGGFCLDQMVQQLGYFNRELIHTNTPAGLMMTILSSRISHVFDFTGPCVSMDTACSSSLVAVHNACNSLRNEECSIAVVGGVNLMLGPEFPILMSRGGFLSKHGKCMAFDARAEGYGRGEGAGIVILKPLSKALQCDDPIYATIRSTGINQDGRTSGISLPNSDAQEALIREVYAKGDISTNDIQYIEAHGTGTQAGDPAELRALNVVLEAGRSGGNKCWVGTVKTNIGHLEAAAGVAGIIKAALVLKHKKIPPNLHFETPNPKIPFDEICLQVPTALEVLPEGEHTTYAAVNSFGYGGTNAHALLEVPPERKTTKAKTVEDGEPDASKLILISAKSPKALTDIAGKYAYFLSAGARDISFEDFQYTLAVRRAHHNCRLACVANTKDALSAQLQAVTAGEYAQGMSMAQTNLNEPRRLVFIYTGMGPQWWGMGRELLMKEPVFRRVWHACMAHFKAISGWDLEDALGSDEATSRVAETQVAQPANFILQVALTELWKSWGIQPSAVVGHSVGEVAAAYVAGALSLEDAIRVSYVRSQLQQTCAGQGGMLAVGIPEAEAGAYLKEFKEVSIAAINSPSAVTLSGNIEELQKIAEQLETNNVFNKFLRVEVAYHSYQMDQIREQILDRLGSIQPRRNEIPLYSTVTGVELSGENWGAEYWWKNVRQTVCFAKVMDTFCSGSDCSFLEVGPHPVLRPSIQECMLNAGKDWNVFSSLKRNEAEQFQLHEALGNLYVNGFELNWAKLVAEGGRLIQLPTYVWQREKCVKESNALRQDLLGRPGHPFFNTKTDHPIPAWEVEINEQFFPYLKDHIVNEQVVFPGAAYIEAGLALHGAVFEKDACILEDVEFVQLLSVENKKVHLLRLSYNNETNEFLLHSRIKEDGQPWQLHAKGSLFADALSNKDVECINFKELKASFKENIYFPDLYKELAKTGLEYGPSFQCIQELWKGEGELLIKVKAKEPLEPGFGHYKMYPTLLDAGLHAILVGGSINATYVLVSVGKVKFYTEIPSECWIHATRGEASDDSLRSSLRILDESGNVFAEIQGVVFQKIARLHSDNTDLYQYHWVEGSRSPASGKCGSVGDTWLVIVPPSDFALSFFEKLSSEGIEYKTVILDDCCKNTEDGVFHIRGDSADDFNRLFEEIGEFNCSKILYFGGWVEVGNNNAGVLQRILRQCDVLTSLLRSLDRLNPKHEITLYTITKNAQSIDGYDDTTDLVGASFSELGQLIENETTYIDYRYIDLKTELDADTAERLLCEIKSNSKEKDLVLLPDNKRLTKQLTRLLDKPVLSEERISVGDLPFKLKLARTGSVENLYYHRMTRLLPAENEIEIKVHATGLNFKDLMKIYGRLPTSVIEGTFFGDTIGMEVSGKVVSVGSGVVDFKPGDRAVATVTGGFASHVTTPTTFAAKIPNHLSCEEVLHTVVFATAYYGLVDIANVRSGEKVLIHSACGGLGLSAIQIAKWRGAEIYATAGSEKKREYLKSLGIEHVFDSRSLEFAEQIREVTHGYGVDVVLNSLSGDALKKSFSLLAPYGRFIEVGKVDIAQNNKLSMQAFNRNLLFASVDFDRMAVERVPVIEKITKKVSKGFSEGYFKPLPTKSFQANQIREAFRYMSKGQHIGKILVKNEESQTLNLRTVRNREDLFLKEGSYLVVGGTGGFGLEVSKWLALNGAGQIILASRKGTLAAEDEQIIAEMKKLGAEVLVESVDVSDPKQVRFLVEKIETEFNSLRGVFHSAMVLDDGLFIELDRKRYEKVLNPKVQGALNLHQYTKELQLDYFVMFSSVSSLTGNPGQANYIVANAFLDAFAPYRRALGLPATTINWGVLSEVGVVQRSQKLGGLLERSGIEGIKTKDALAILEKALSEDLIQLGAFKIDWDTWAEVHPSILKSSRFKSLLNTNGNSEMTRLALHREQLALLSDSEQSGYIDDKLKRVFSQMLKIPTEKIQMKQSLQNLGVDSLMLIELLLLMKNEFSVELSKQDLSGEVTLDTLGNNVLEKIKLINK